MNILIPIAIILLVLIFIGFKMNNIRTKMAFFFILFGVFAVLFITFLLISGENFNFSSIGGFFASIRVYFLWIKGAVVSVFELTGRFIGLDINPSNATILGR